MYYLQRLVALILFFELNTFNYTFASNRDLFNVSSMKNN